MVSSTVREMLMIHRIPHHNICERIMHLQFPKLKSKKKDPRNGPSSFVFTKAKKNSISNQLFNIVFSFAVFFLKSN